MEIKDIIRKKREELNLTYEQLGNIVGVGKSTVRKWETGMIENMRRDNIVALSKALNISPITIMGWDIQEDINKEKKISKDESILLENFNKLNINGKRKVIDYTEDLINNNKYINKKDNVNQLVIPLKSKDEKESFTLAAHDDDLDSETTERNLEKAKTIFKLMDEE